MSRSALVMALAVLAIPAGAAAQNPESEADRRVQGYITTQEEKAGLRRRCYSGASPAEAIIVCAPLDPDANRLPRRNDRDEPAGRPDARAPNLAGPGIFKGPATVGNLCLLPPCPGIPVYFVDVDSLPETPPGSDADKVGRGEMSDR